MTDGAVCPTSPDDDQPQRPATIETTQRLRKQADGDLWLHSFRLSRRHRAEAL
jgi:hypothetical protein